MLLTSEFIHIWILTRCSPLSNVNYVRLLLSVEDLAI